MGTTDVEALLLRIEASATKLEKDMAKNYQVFNRGARRMEAQARTVGTRIGGALGTRLTAAFSTGVSRFAGVAVGALALDKFVDASQVFVRLSNSLKVAGLSGDELTKTYEDLFKVAQENGTPIETLVGLYSKAAQAQTNLGASSDELIAFSTAVAQALRVSGTSATEASGALMQLGQSISGNVVQAEEYNSLIDGAYPLLQAAAAGMRETGGDVAKLTALVKEGKISAKAFFDAILAGAPILSDKLAGSQDTVAASSTRMYNSFVNAVGKFDEVLGVADKTTATMDAISAALDRNAGDWAAWAENVTAYVRGLNLTVSMGLPTPGAGTKESFGTMVGRMGGELGNMSGRNGAYTTGGGFGGESGYNAGAGYEALNDYYRKHPITIPAEVKPISLKDYPVTGSKSSGGGSKENAYERELKQARQRTEEISAMIPLIGKEASAIDQAKVAQDLKNAATEAGIKLTPERLAEIEQVSAAYGEQARIYDQLQQKQEALQQSQQFFADTAFEAISGLAIEGEDLGDVFENLAKSIAKAALQAALLGQGPLANLFGGAGKNGGLGGVFGALFGGLGGGSSGPLNLGSFLSLDGGGYTGPGGKYQPAGVVHRGEYVFDQESVKAAGGPAALDAMRRGLRGYAGGGYVSPNVPALPAMLARQTSPAITYAPVIDARGADAAAVARLERAMKQNQKDFAKNVVGVQKAASVRRTVS